MGKYATDIQNGLPRDESDVLKQATIKEMLTPSQNELGQGPNLANEREPFNHSRANKDFRCDLFAAWDGSFAVNIMTNSDNCGAVYFEIIQAVFDYYGWPGFEPDVRTVVDLTEEQMMGFTETLEIADTGLLELIVEDVNVHLAAAGLVDEQFILRA